MTPETPTQTLARQLIDLPGVITTIRRNVELGDCTLDQAMEAICEEIQDAVEDQLADAIDGIREDIREARIQDEERRVIASTY